VDHYGLNKFGSRSANYKIVLSKLLEIITPFASQRRDHLYSVPLETVHSYTERHRLSSAIGEKLRTFHENSSIPHALAIYGLGGTGKTQLALKYIEDHKDDYNPILWIDAKNPETVRSSFERCVSDLQLSVDRASTRGSALADSATVQAVLRWLQHRKESNDEWLVVVDNADDVTWGISKILPKGRRGNVIVTSQDDQSPRLFNRGCEKLRVDIMEPCEARTLLLQHLEWDPDSAPQDVQNFCDTIVERLGYLALAIDFAGAYIGNDSSQEAALKRYLADYGRHQDELLQSDYFRGLSTSDKTVWTVWDTTLEKIESRHPDVQPGLFLAFLAHFNRGIIQDELFRLASLGSSVVNKELGRGDQDLSDWLKRLIKLGGQEWDSFYYRKALEPLIRYNLLQRVDGEWPGVTMHSLVQWRAMKYEEDQPWSLWHLMFILAASHQISEEEARPQFRRYMVTHIPVARQSNLDDMRIDDEKKAFVWNTISRVYYDEGQWKEAEELLRQELETCSRVLGQEHPSTLTSMANLASTFWNQGRWKEAEELDVQVMETTLHGLN
jgi:tetratricopeptide (TPR) repeat protein